MAELILCPWCKEWLNLELHEAIMISNDYAEIIYMCKKCGAIFNEDDNILKKGAIAR